MLRSTRSRTDCRRRSGALQVALLRAEPEGSAQGPAAVAAAFLTVLRELASRTRLLVAIDDVQWLDSASALVLQFAARRLEHEPVRLLLTARSEGDAPSVDLVRSSAIACATSRSDRSPWAPPAHAPRAPRAGVRAAGTRRIHDAAAAIRSSRCGFRACRRGRANGRCAPRSRDTARAGSRSPPLPAGTSAALVTVAALGHPQISLVASVVPDWEEAFPAAVDAGVLEVRGDRLSRILASVVYADAPEEHRRAVHRALAEVVEDAEQRAWHLARATEQPDDDVAAALDSAEERAAARGAPETAAELAEHARRLTPADRSGPRAAAWTRRCTWAAGDGASRQMLAELIESLPPSATRAQARQLLVKIIDDIPETIEQLASALDDAAADLAQQASVLNLLSRQRTWAGDFDRAIADAQAAADIARSARPPSAVALREAQARAFAGEPIAQELLGRAIALEQQLGDAIPVETAPRGSAERAPSGATTWRPRSRVPRRSSGGRQAGRRAGRRSCSRSPKSSCAVAIPSRRSDTSRKPRKSPDTGGESRRGGRACRHRAREGRGRARRRGPSCRRAGPRADAPRRLRRHRPFGGASARIPRAFTRRCGGRPRCSNRSSRDRESATPPRPPPRRTTSRRSSTSGRSLRRKLCSPGSRRTSAGLVTRARRLRCAGARRSSPRYEKLDAAAAYAQEAIATSGEQLEPLERGRALLVLGQIRRRERQRHAARERSRRLARSSRSAVPHSGRSGREPSCRESAAAASRDELTERASRRRARREGGRTARSRPSCS